MVRMRTGDFALDVPESSNARAGAVATGPRGPAPASTTATTATTTFIARESLATASHAE
jgi:hypothetical protein